MTALDTYYAFKFIRILTQPWTETDAFKLGIVDAEGNQLKKRLELSYDEKMAFTRFHKLVFSLKKTLERVPFMKSTLAKYATALMMIKEECGIMFDVELMEMVKPLLKEDTEDLHKLLEKKLEEFNSVGGIDMGGGSILPLNKRNHGVDFEEDIGDDVFAGTTIFDCDPATFQNCRLGKKKYARYSKYVGEEEQGERIRQYGRKFPKNGIVVRDKDTGAMRYLRKNTNA